jgi:TolA-binding protein
MIKRGRAMVRRTAGAAMVAVFLAGPAPQALAQVAQDAGGEKTIAELAERDMNIGRYNIGKRNYTGAINRFKTVITQYPTSANAEEALARLAESYLSLGITAEAQCAVAVLQRKFPDGHWSHEALDALRSRGLEPAEDERSYISRAFH